MLAELESRLRVELHTTDDTSLNTTEDLTSIVNSASGHSRAFGSSLPLHDPLIYWGYLVKNRFMAGELYALSWSLTDWVAKEPVLKTMIKGAEDKQTAKWMALHPRASEVRWASEHCWIYDHPRAGSVYSHGFLFPSEVSRVRRSMDSWQDKASQGAFNDSGSLTGAVSLTPADWAHSSVSTFGVRYNAPIQDLTPAQSVEALVEGSDMSMLREGSPMTPEYAWQHREGRKKRYEGRRVGGTIVVHFIKKHMWFLEAASAFLEGEEFSEAEKFHQKEAEKDKAWALSFSNETLPQL